MWTIWSNLLLDIKTEFIKLTKNHHKLSSIYTGGKCTGYLIKTYQKKVGYVICEFNSCCNLSPLFELPIQDWLLSSSGGAVHTSPVLGHGVGQCRLRNDGVPMTQLATVSVHPDTDVARLPSSCGCRLRGKGWTQGYPGEHWA